MDKDTAKKQIAAARNDLRYGNTNAALARVLDLLESATAPEPTPPPKPDAAALAAALKAAGATDSAPPPHVASQTGE